MLLSIFLKNEFGMIAELIIIKVYLKKRNPWVSLLDA